jgi:hypothetical protein
MTTISATSAPRPASDPGQTGAGPSKVTIPTPWQEILDRIGATTLPSPAERAAQTAKAEAAWHATKAKVVYRVNDIPVYFRDEDGVGVIESDADAALYHAARTEGEAQGLAGDALDDYANRRFEQLMIDKHGDALEIEKYGDATDAPNVGELLAEMEEALFGRSMEERLPAAATALVQFHGDTLARLHDDEPVPTR